MQKMRDEILQDSAELADSNRFDPGNNKKTHTTTEESNDERIHSTSTINNNTSLTTRSLKKLIIMLLLALLALIALDVYLAFLSLSDLAAENENLRDYIMK